MRVENFLWELGILVVDLEVIKVIEVVNVMFDFFLIEWDEVELEVLLFVFDV